MTKRKMTDDAIAMVHDRVVGDVGRVITALKREGVDTTFIVAALFRATAVLSIEADATSPDDSLRVFESAWIEARNAHVDRLVERAKASRTLGDEMIGMATGGRKKPLPPAYPGEPW